MLQLYVCKSLGCRVATLRSQQHRSQSHYLKYKHYSNLIQSQNGCSDYNFYSCQYGFAKVWVRLQANNGRGVAQAISQRLAQDVICRQSYLHFLFLFFFPFPSSGFGHTALFFVVCSLRVFHPPTPYSQLHRQRKTSQHCSIGSGFAYLLLSKCL